MAGDLEEFHEALQCPRCPELFVESLWSLIAHINCSHPETPSILDFKVLQGCKRIVSKSRISIIRPAFKEDGKMNEVFNFDLEGKFNSKNTESLGSPKISNSLDSESNDEAGNSISVFSQETSFEKNSEDKNHEISNSSFSLETDNLETQLPYLKLMEKRIYESCSGIFEKNSESSDSNLPTGGNNRVKRQLPYSRTSKKQVCNSCGEIFDNRCLLTLHLMEHKKKTHPFQCQIRGCFQCYDSKLKFKSHLTRVHRELNSEDVENLLKGKALSFLHQKNSKSENSEIDPISPENKLTKIVEKIIKSEIVEK
ncbi:hypothetical protein FO519_002618 [Halicephalobus sp. NKZ332]|nr:hypothetical protein FO519_002618 [Halicephalobus sp. NKZ332]